MRIYKTRLAKTKYHTYIIRSDIEGADVLFDNVNIGQIDNGILYYKIKETEDTGSHTVQLQNGTLPVKEDYYIFNQIKQFTIDANGGRYNFVNHGNIESMKCRYTYNMNNEIKTLTIESNICTINAIQREHYIDVDFSPTYHDVESNLTTIPSTVIASITQDESGKQLTAIIQQSAGIEYTYTINSDIEGALVRANNQAVGTINNSQCVFTRWNNQATDLNISLESGQLVSKEPGYTFEVSNPSSNVSADGGTFDVSSIVTSVVGTYTPKHPANAVCSPNGSVTMNTAYNYNTSDAAYTVIGNVTFAENETSNPVSREITITQTDTNQSETVTITQEAGVLHNYTVLSDCEGAQVNINGTNRGTINNGQFVYSVWNSKAPASVSISLTGGLPSNPATDYTFSISPTNVSFDEDGSTKSVTITSRKTTHTYVNTSGTCQRDSSVTCNAKLNDVTSNVTYSASESLSWITTSGNSITANANSTYNSRSGSITYTQSESGKTATVNVSQEAKSLYTYTVNSNCNGGTVYFNNINKGTISNGKLVFTDEASSGTVRISGGVPSNYQSQTDTDYDYDTEYDTEYDYVYRCECLDDSTTWNPNQEGDQYSIQVACNTGTRSRTNSRNGTRTRPIYTNYNYSAPSSRTCQGNSSVTMNYSSSTSTSYGSWSSWSWGSWSYGSWGSWSYSRVIPDVTNVTASYFSCTRSTTIGSGSNSGYLYNISIDANNSSTTRYIGLTFKHPSNSNEYFLFNITQQGIEYVFETAGTLNPLSASRTSGSSSDQERGGTSFGIKCYKKVGSTITQLGISMDSHSQINDWWASNGSTYGENKGTNTGWQVNFSANQSPYVANTNNPFKTHSYTVTMRQKESNKTLSVTVKQYDYYIAFTTSGVGTLNWNFPYTAGNGGNTCWLGCQNGYKAVNWVAGTGANHFGSYDPIRGTNGTQFFFNASANNSFDIRKGSIPFSIDDGNTIHGATINITQQAAPNIFYINGSNLGSGNYAISRGSVTSLNTTGTVPLINVVGISKCEINSVLTANNSNTVAAPFTAYTSQSFKLWRRAGNTGSWTLVKTFSVSPNGTITA